MTFEGFTPHPKQRTILEGIIEGEEFYHVVSVGRQFGKTLLGINLLLYYSINFPESISLWISPVHSQVDKVLKQVIKGIEDSGIVKNINLTKGYIELVNGSQLIFMSSVSDGIRGWSVDYLYIDEAAFISDKVFLEEIKPTLSVRGKRCILFSTPKGKNFFYDYFLLGEDESNSNYRSYKGSSYDSPFINVDLIEDNKKVLPESVFRQEYLAEFLENGGEVFTNLDSITFNSWPSEPSQSYYCGIDLGRQEDFTVATILNHKGEVVEVYRKNQTSWTIILNDLEKLLKKYKKVYTYVEVNSIGDVLYESLSKKVKNIKPFTTTSKSKQDLIESLILAVNNKDVQIPSVSLYEPLYKELSYFTYTYNPSSRTIKYTHPMGAHDDTVVSLALANYSMKNFKGKGSYSWVA